MLNRFVEGTRPTPNDWLVPVNDLREYLRPKLEAEEAGAPQPHDIEARLREQFPHGHPAFISMALAEVALHSDKNRDYTGVASDPLGNFHRVAALLARYPGLDLSKPSTNAIVQMLKQLDAALNMVARGYEGKVEGEAARWRDIAVFAKLIPVLREEERGGAGAES